MRKIYLLLFCLVLSVVQLLAQGVASPWWSVRAGVNFSNLSSPTYSTGYLTGYAASLTYAYPISEVIPIYIESGLNFQKRGAQDNGFLIEGGETSTFKRTELEIPLSLGYHIWLPNEWSIQTTVGAYYSLALDGSFSMGDEKFNPYEEEMLQTLRDVRATEQQLLHRSDFGVRLGVYLLYERYLFGFVFNGGLLNLYSRSLRNNGYQARSGSFALQLGYNF